MTIYQLKRDLENLRKQLNGLMWNSVKRPTFEKALEDLNERITELEKKTEKLESQHQFIEELTGHD